MPPVGSQGIVSNWKSRWMCMSFLEETATTEIKPNTLYNVNILHLCLRTLPILLLFLFSSHFPHDFFPYRTTFISSLLVSIHMTDK